MFFCFCFIFVFVGGWGEYVCKIICFDDIIGWILGFIISRNLETISVAWSGGDGGISVETEDCDTIFVSFVGVFKFSWVFNVGFPGGIKDDSDESYVSIVFIFIVRLINTGVQESVH